MTDELQLALGLMAIGMTTVFAILALVVQGGRLIIFLVNKFAPEERGGEPLHEDKNHVAVIAAVTDIVTQGTGRVEKISKK